MSLDDVYPGLAVFETPNAPQAPGLPASVPVPGSGADGRPTRPDPAEGRYCRLCLHHRGQAPAITCEHPQFVTIEPVGGEVVGRTAIGMRHLGQPCGPDGKLFEPISARRRSPSSSNV